MYKKFTAMYATDIRGGRPSIAPEKLMRAMLLQVLFSIRSDSQLVEQINYNLLFRWFVGLSIDELVWNHPVFSKNRDRLIEHEAVTELFNATVNMSDKRGLLSGEHFSADGTLIKAWARHKSMRRKDGSDDDRPPDDWRGGSAIDQRTTRHFGCGQCIKARKRIEQCFGWGETVGSLAQVMVRGLDKVDQV